MRAGTRRIALTTAALTGAVVGAVVTMTLTDPGTSTPAAGPSGARSDATSTTLATTTTPASETTSEAPGPVLLVWTSGGLPDGFAEQVQNLAGVVATTTVRGDETAMLASFDAAGDAVGVPPPGWHVALDTLAVDPASFAAFLTGDAADAVRALSAGEALLTDTSARLRSLGPGGTIRLAGGDVTITGIIDDHAGAGSELVVPLTDAERLDVTTARYVLVRHSAARDDLQHAIAAHLDGRAVRFRSPAETAWLRHGDAVAPPAAMKIALGEFAVRDRAGRGVEIDPAWVARSITTEPVPILGEVTCHRTVIEPLRAAMEDLEAANLAHLVDAGAFAGCFAARRIAVGQPLSHHAWGAALDLNVDGNPRGSFSTQDPRLVETMARHGFTWGGTWLVPDPAHYEAPFPARS